jgi:hypothetical protein
MGFGTRCDESRPVFQSAGHPGVTKPAIFGPVNRVFPMRSNNPKVQSLGNRQLPALPVPGSRSRLLTTVSRQPIAKIPLLSPIPPSFPEFEEFSESPPNLCAEPNVLAASAGLARPGRHRSRVFRLTRPRKHEKLT